MPLFTLGQTLQPDYGAPTAPVSVCDGSVIFKIKVIGSSQACASGTIDIELPTGYVFTNSSAFISGGTGNVSQVAANGATARLQVNNIPASPGFTEISYRAYANCSAIGTSTNVESLAKYTLSSPCLGTYAVTSNTFNTQTAALSISLTNGNYSGSIGGTFSRDIKITNNGLGTISQITLKDTIANGLDLLSHSISSGWTVSRTSTALGSDTIYTYLLTGPSLAQGQSVTITETLKILNACNLQSRMYSYFGCSLVPCTDNNVTASATAGVTVNNAQSANLVITPTMQALACRGTDYEQVVQFANTGTAALTNLSANIFSSTWSAVPGTQYFNPARSYTSGGQSGFSTILYKVGASGTWNVLPLDSVKSFTSPGSAIGGYPSSLYFTIPSIAAGESVYVKYQERNSPLPGINVGNTMEVSGNELWYSYQDGCGNRTSPVATFLRNFVQLRINNDPNIPSNMEPGQTYAFSYAFTESNTGIYTYTAANGQSYIRFDLVLPANVAFVGNASSIAFTKGGSPLACGLTNFSYSAATRTVAVTMPVTSSCNINTLNGSILTYNDMQLNCTATSTGSNVVFNTYVRSKTDCANEEQMSTLSTKIGLMCPAPCGTAGGLTFKDFSFARKNYGAPDNESGGGNGVADASGSLDMSTVKTNYALMGDTLTASFYGTVTVTPTSPAAGFTHGVAIDTFSVNGSYLTGLYASVQLYSSGSSTPFYSSSSLPVNGGTTNYRTVYFSIDTLKKYSTLPAGYTKYNDGDSVVVKIYYRLNNQASALTTVDITNGFSINSVPITTSALRAQFACGSRYTGRYVIVNKGVGSAHGNLTYSITGNNTATLQGTNVGYIGPCCTTAGSKLFVNEYRPVTIYDEVTFTVPDGYDYVSAKVTYVSTTNPSGTYSQTVSVSPTNPGASTLVFNTKALYENGSLRYGDQGSAFYFYPIVRPNCAAKDKAVGTITIRQVPLPGFTFANYTSSHADTIYLTRPKLTATVTNANVITNTNTVSWEVQVANANNITASSVWLAKNNTPSGVTITSIYKLSGPGGSTTTPVNPDANGIYKLGNFAQTSAYYRVSANYTSCVKDSLSLAYWYDCSSSGYPGSVTAQPYRQDVDMYVQPQQPSLQLSIVDQPAAAPHNSCDQLDYTVEVLNAGSGNANSPNVVIYLPSSGGLSYSAGTFKLEYPSGSNNYVNVPDANVTVSSSSITLNVPSSYYATLTTNQKFKVKYGLNTSCNFTSGQAIRFGASSVSPCGVVSNGITQQTEKIEMAGVPSTKNLYDLRSSVDTAKQGCHSTADLTTPYRFVLVNQGPLVTSSADLYSIELPSNWTMDLGSIAYSRNPSAAHYSYTNNGIYYFTTGTNLAVGDSLIMTATLRMANAYASSLMNGSTDPIRENAIILYSGTCSSSGSSCPSSQAIVSSRYSTRIPYTNYIPVNPNVYGTNNTWNGYMFQGTSFQTYKGAVTEGNNNSPNFDENFGGSTVNYATDACTVYTENFSARYMLTKFFVAGSYKMTVGGGDGYRFSTDGGNTWIINQWSTHSYGTTDITLALDGAYDMVIEYFGATGPNRVSYKIETLSVLPVSLESFTGNLVNGEMKLNWQMSGGHTVATFYVERASSNGVYTAIGTVAAGKLGTRNYSFTDAIPLQGRSSYRLRMVDENGKATYSVVLPLVINGNADASLQVFPSFVTNQTFNIQSATTLNNVKLTISDMNGRLLKSMKLGRVNASAKQLIEANGALHNSGIYTVFIEADELTTPVVKKLIVP